MTAQLPDPNSPTLKTLAQLCKSTGDPLRMEILRALKTDSFGVLELCEIFAVKQPAMSHHLKVLANTGAVATRREGNSIFYRRALPNAKHPQGQLLTALFSAIDQIPLGRQTQAYIQKIKLERESIARDFFDRHATQFRQQQDLIAQFEQYSTYTTDMLLKTGIIPQQTALEIGPGEGDYLPTLSPLFHQVWAIDISKEMLESAASLCGNHGLQNIQLVHGDTATARHNELSVDRIICNMVLHHVPSPADVFHDCANLLKDSGSLIITDLCRHDQVWAKDNCGDLWLGFDPEELTEWAQAAGLLANEGVYLGLRNGFQIQIRRFDKPNTHST